MAEHTITFSTFLKLLELPDGGKKSALRGFLRAGGYRYWRPLQELARPVAKKELSLSELQEQVAIMAKGHQRKYNEAALTSLLKWVSRRTIVVHKSPDKQLKEFGTAGLKIKLDPELTFSMGGIEYLMHVWATNSPPLSEETLSMGLYFFRSCFTKLYPNHQYLIFDTVKNNVFTELAILDSAKEMLAAQRNKLDKIWTELNTSDDEHFPDEHPDSHAPPPL